ncbi:MAG: SDR family NAD(P)-dependent oxidoreductase [Deltaproteobacteria bacterium]|nr:SDR family NAD(P)-dependent oxidoreductase [Deltaproteobacteria bacterium]
MSTTREGVCVVTGVGPGTGAALCRRFAETHRVAMLARSADALRELAGAIEGTRAYPTDVTDAEAVRSTFARIRSELGPVRVLLHNAGNATFGDFSRITPDQFEQAWKVNALALVLCGQEAARDMEAQGGGAIVITGATASLRGGEGFAAFAPAKAAQRSLAQSMARHLGPKGIHVAYVIVDGVIDMPTTRRFLPDRPDEQFLQPAAIAETFHHVVHQDRSAWTFEVDVRPFGEKW